MPGGNCPGKQNNRGYLADKNCGNTIQYEYLTQATSHGPEAGRLLPRNAPEFVCDAYERWNPWRPG